MSCCGSFTTIAQALGEHHHSKQAHHYYKMIAVVDKVSLDVEWKKGYMVVSDSALGDDNNDDSGDAANTSIGISLDARHFTVASTLVPGNVVLILGLENISSKKGNKGVSSVKGNCLLGHQFKFAPSHSDHITELKHINDLDEIHHVYNHPLAIDLVELSNRIKNKSLSTTTTSTCCTRRLSDIVGAGGLLHDVVVRVVSCEEVAVATRVRGRKRQRRSKGYATLKDRDGETMVLKDCRAFLTQLESAKEVGSYYRITNLKSRKEGALGEMVLIATSKTLILEMNDQEADVSRTPNNAIGNATQPGTLSGRPRRVVASGIASIFFADTNVTLEAKHCVSPSGVASMLIQSEDIVASSYRKDASIILVDSSTHQGVVKAGPKILQALCGDVEPNEVINHVPTRRLVLELLRALLTEQTCLRWILEDDQVVQVEIPLL